MRDFVDSHVLALKATFRHFFDLRSFGKENPI